MLESLLKPIAIEYYGSEYTRDSSHYLEALIEWKQQGVTNDINQEDLHLIAIDIEALYPSLDHDFTIDIVCNEFLESPLKINNINYVEVRLYLSLNRDEEYLWQKNIKPKFLSIISNAMVG